MGFSHAFEISAYHYHHIFTSRIWIFSSFFFNGRFLVSERERQRQTETETDSYRDR